MKNTLEDLNNHLFAEIERLSDEDLKGENLNNADLVLKAAKFKDDILIDGELPRLLGGK